MRKKVTIASFVLIFALFKEGPHALFTSPRFTSLRSRLLEALPETIHQADPGQ